MLSYLLLLFFVLGLAIPQRLPYISPTDDSRRIIPTTQDNGDGGTVSNVSTEICATPPPPYGFRDRVSGLSQARLLERRGLNVDSSGLARLGLGPSEALGTRLLEEELEDEEAAGNGTEVVWTTGKKVKRMVKRAIPTPLVIETYFHIVSTRDMSRFFNEKLRTQIVKAQAAALNLAYRSANITFRLNTASFVIKDQWATDLDSTSMKQALRKGKYGALNIYFQSNLSSAPGSPGAPQLLGYCTLPTSITYAYGGQTYEYPAANWATDGCNILAGSMPGSPNAIYGYDRGKTAVHEVGHWFGLLHTFQDNTCDSASQGDYVDDTPQEATSTVGCPKGKDSCPTRFGLDPIRNYMDYSIDECYTEFSNDQMQRMKDLYNLLRKGH